MLDLYKEVIAKQFEAALCTLDTCLDRCPEDVWEAAVGKITFNQLAFHTIFSVDYYLGADAEAQLEQAFHRGNKSFFGDYEELDFGAPVSVYEKNALRKYVKYCRSKASEVLASETAESLKAPCGFKWDVSRAELYMFNIRHIQHHSGQLSMRLRMDAGEGIPWIGSGWRET